MSKKILKTKKTLRTSKKYRIGGLRVRNFEDFLTEHDNALWALTHIHRGASKKGSQKDWRLRISLEEP